MLAFGKESCYNDAQAFLYHIYITLYGKIIQNQLLIQNGERESHVDCKEEGGIC
ncbi:MAG: hypothetical protein K2N63_04215 [Lachnospiraceae bacterium]|nr:hypothetical protein [Lachnospiraceae bacterium]